MLSSILSSYNETDNAAFWANLQLLKKFANVEVLVIDGGSQDGTLELLKSQNVVVMPGTERSQRYNRGLELALGERILLIHPRSELSREGLEHLLRLPMASGWGAFRHSFDWDRPLLRFTSWYSNFARGRGRGIFYLDHCLFLSADLKPYARFPEVGLFEDTGFCLGLRSRSWPQLLPYPVVTSAVRFRKNGLVWQSLMNQVLKLLFYLGFSEKWMNRVYEKGLALNARSE